ncbi:glycosyltransferase [bacterium]|jgi:cellulose synthase/poly-beta-1,6-N-acetylglucosamine synthase-like glycosyltransferase|nr:glycosyltransferase [bacterium]
MIEELLNHLLIGVYALNVSFLLLMGIHAYLACYQFLRARKTRQNLGFPLFSDPPSVLVQLPIYNEHSSIEQLLDSVNQLDYQADRLRVQILDDSDDETSHVVDEYLKTRALKFQFSHVRRSIRTGFKAGALKAGLELDPSAMIAIFDADFRPGRDFVLKAVSRLIQDPDLGLIQGRWEYINAGASFWTRFQAVGMDGHFAIEQPARAWNGYFMNFNGTAGVWRRQAIEEAGNWEGDTLTEDLDLSYRAQLAGWKLDYALDLPCPSEIPESIFAFKSQQFRWAKGSIQTLIKLFPRILKSSATLMQKVEAGFHLTHYLIHPLLVLNFLIGCYILFHPELLLQFPLEYFFVFILFASTGPSMLYQLSQKALNKEVPGGIFFYILMIALGCGMAWNNTRAVWQAITGVDSPFVRTPKAGNLKRKYLPTRNLQFLVELSLAGVGIIALLNATTGFYFLVPFLVLYTMGFLMISIGSFTEWISALDFGNSLTRSLSEN